MLTVVPRDFDGLITDEPCFRFPGPRTDPPDIERPMSVRLSLIAMRHRRMIYAQAGCPGCGGPWVFTRPDALLGWDNPASKLCDGCTKQRAAVLNRAHKVEWTLVVGARPRRSAARHRAA